MTVDEISSIDDALSSRFAAVCSVRDERSIEAEAISLLACTSDSDEPRTRVTMLRSDFCMSDSEPIRLGRLVLAPGAAARW